MVTLANPANLPQLLDLANAIAAERGGEVIGLRIATVPEQLAPNRDDFSSHSYVTRERPLLEMANRYAAENRIPFTSQIDVGHDPARAILESARKGEIDRR